MLFIENKANKVNNLFNEIDFLNFMLLFYYKDNKSQEIFSYSAVITRAGTITSPLNLYVF